MSAISSRSGFNCWCVESCGVQHKHQSPSMPFKSRFQYYLKVLELRLDVADCLERELPKRNKGTEPLKRRTKYDKIHQNPLLYCLEMDPPNWTCLGHVNQHSISDAAAANWARASFPIAVPQWILGLRMHPDIGTIPHRIIPPKRPTC